MWRRLNGWGFLNVSFSCVFNFYFWNPQEGQFTPNSKCRGLRVSSFSVTWHNTGCDLNYDFLAPPFHVVFCYFQEAECAYVLFVVAIFWLTEAVPLSVTALLPGLMFPLFGIMPSKMVSGFKFSCKCLPCLDCLFYSNIFTEKTDIYWQQ